MMATQPPAGLTDEQLDEMEGLTDEQLNASEESRGIIPEVDYINRVGRGMANEVGSQLSAVGQVVRHPFNALTAAAKEALAGLASPASRSAELVSSLPGVAKGIAQQATTPEGQGALLVQGAEAAIPVGRIGAAVARRGVPILGGATEASRAYNIKRALRIPTGSGPKAIEMAQSIERLTPEIELPITKSPQRLADALEARVAATGTGVDVAEAALPQRSMPTADVIGRIAQPEGAWRMVGDTMEFVPYNPEKYAQWRASVANLERLGPEMSTAEAIGAKRAAQEIARDKGAYVTPEAKGAAAAAEERGAALRQSLEALPGPEAEAFTAANRAHHVAKTIAAPAVAEATRWRGLPLANRGNEMLFGRAFTQNPSVLGAVGGVLAGNILDSRLFHTASAAAKRAVIDALQSGQPQLAADILFKSAVAARQTRRTAEDALRAQGEGVTQP